MGTSRMQLHKVVSGLDEFFAVSGWEQDPAMSRWVPRVYQRIGYDYTSTLEPDFCRRYNGLMLRSGDAVSEIFLAVFPSPDVLNRIEELASGESLLVVHHPVDMEVSAAGFLPILPDSLARLQAKGVSIYACHAPLDCHDDIGTTASIARAFGVCVDRHFAPLGKGLAGRIGAISPISCDELASLGRRIFGVARVEIGGIAHDEITRIAIVAGGGDDTQLMQEAEQLGAQAYVTGEWFTRTTPCDTQGSRWAEVNRAACRVYAEASAMCFLGFSHAATEYLVMRNEMADYFRTQNLQVVCVEQADWWR